MFSSFVVCLIYYMVFVFGYCRFVWLLFGCVGFGLVVMGFCRGLVWFAVVGVLEVLFFCVRCWC